MDRGFVMGGSFAFFTYVLTASWAAMRKETKNAGGENRTQVIPTMNTPTILDVFHWQCRHVYASYALIREMKIHGLYFVGRANLYVNLEQGGQI